MLLYDKTTRAVAANLASLNEVLAEVVQALADHGWSDPEFAGLARRQLRDHSRALGYQFQGESPGDGQAVLMPREEGMVRGEAVLTAEGRAALAGRGIDLDQVVVPPGGQLSVSREVYRTVVGQAEPGDAVRVRVFPPGCDGGLLDEGVSSGCLHHYDRNMAAEGCICPSWFDGGGGWHLIEVNPSCTAHDVPGERQPGSGT